MIETHQTVTAKSEILRVLAVAPQPLAVHELGALIPRYSDNALATRVSELHAEGKIVGRTRLGEVYKEWRLATADEQVAVVERRRAERRTAAKPAGEVIGINTVAEEGYETALVRVRVPIGTFQMGQEVRLA